MLKSLVVVALILFPSAAYADGFKITTEAKVEYEKTYSEGIRSYINPTLGFLLETYIGERKSELWIAPAFNFGFENGKVGPELRFPVANTRVWEMILRLEMDIFSY